MEPSMDETSSMAFMYDSWERPSPPYSRGILIPNAPRSRRPWMTASGISPSRSMRADRFGPHRPRGGDPARAQVAQALDDGVGDLALAVDAVRIDLLAEQALELVEERLRSPHLFGILLGVG